MGIVTAEIVLSLEIYVSDLCCGQMLDKIFLAKSKKDILIRF